ncbi:MAG: ribosomal protein S18-alanine N-acetyltransferase [Hyphomicrobiales bacterium]|nr:ribosomal protein S18-alanine N-acetyltransferase [Hyphomicrobiales bacterium]
MQKYIRKKRFINRENLNYREVRYDEIDKVTHIIKSGYHKDWGREFFYKMIDNENYILNIIKLNNKIIGFVAMQIAIDECDIIMIIIDKKYRGNGYSNYLIEETLRFLMVFGIKKIFLDVAKNNYPAIHLYEKFGFEKTNERPAYYKYNNIEIDALSYRLVNN